MGLFTKCASKITPSSRRGRCGTGRARPPVVRTAAACGSTMERLEGRQFFSVSGPAAIATEYLATGHQTDANGHSVQSLLGSATSGVVAVPGVSGAMEQTFHDNGVIYWSAKTGAHVIYGDIGAEYVQTSHETDAFGTNVQKILGLPTADEGNLSGVTGARRSPFQGGTILWSAKAGAHALYGDVAVEYAAVAKQTDAYGTNIQKYIGLPTADEAPFSPVGGARVARFQGGSIYWSSQAGAHVLYGGVAAEYNAVAGQTNSAGTNVQQYIGLPTKDEAGFAPVSGARVTPFQGGAIYWSGTTGAHVLYGAIASEYATTARQTNSAGVNVQKYIGLPTADEAATPYGSGGRVVTFQAGEIDWSPATGAHVLYGAIYGEFRSLVNETDAYGTSIRQYIGLPTSDEAAAGPAGGRANTFQGGTILWSASTGAHVTYGGIGYQYAVQGGAYSWLGLPTSDEAGSATFRYQYFQDGYIVWDPTHGATAYAD